MTRAEFGKFYGTLCLYYDKPVKPELVDIAFRDMGNYTLDEMISAWDIHRATNDYFPRNLAKYLQPDPDAAATLAFAEVKRLVAKYGPYDTLVFDGQAALTGQVILRLGGWQKLCNMTVEEFGYQFHKDFITMYKAMCHGKHEPVRFIGLTELENKRTGMIGKFDTYQISGFSDTAAKRITAKAEPETKQIAAPKEQFSQMINGLKEKLEMAVD